MTTPNIATTDWKTRWTSSTRHLVRPFLPHQKYVNLDWCASLPPSSCLPVSNCSTCSPSPCTGRPSSQKSCRCGTSHQLGNQGEHSWIPNRSSNALSTRYFDQNQPKDYSLSPTAIPKEVSYKLSIVLIRPSSRCYVYESLCPAWKITCCWAVRRHNFFFFPLALDFWVLKASIASCLAMK